MNIDELKRSYPALWQQIFAQGFNCGIQTQAQRTRDDSERRQVEAAELIANATSGVSEHAAVFTLGSIQNALASNRERSATLDR